MLKRLAFIIMFLFLFVGVAASYEVPRTVLLTENFERHYRDADKAWDGDDDFLCWAAVLSNMLAFATNMDENEFFNWYKKTVENKGNSFMYGMRVFCKEYIEENDMHRCTAFMNMDYVNYYRMGNMRNWIVGSLIRNEILGLGARGLFGGWHAITVYGYTLDEEDRFYLYWTDSNDGKRMMYKDKVLLTPNDVLIFGSGRLAGYAIYEVVTFPLVHVTSALDMNRDDLEYKKMVETDVETHVETHVETYVETYVKTYEHTEEEE